MRFIRVSIKFIWLFILYCCVAVSSLVGIASHFEVLARLSYFWKQRLLFFVFHFLFYLIQLVFVFNFFVRERNSCHLLNITRLSALFSPLFISKPNLWMLHELFENQIIIVLIIQLKVCLWLSSFIINWIQ